MEKSSVGSQSRQNINPKNRDTWKKVLLGVKVVKISTLKTETHGKICWESKSSKYQPQKQRHMGKSVGSQSRQNINPKNRDTWKNLLGVKVVKISTPKTETHGKICWESKSSK